MTIEEREAYKKLRRDDYHNNKEARMKKHKEWLSIPENYQKSLEKAREYKLSNNLKIRKQKAEKRKKCPIRKISELTRSRILSGFKNWIKGKVKKPRNTISLLGCSFKELKEHLENQFLTGMTWENHGYGKNKWVIDHIIPICSFDLSNLDRCHKAFNYKNVRPLWWIDNQKKMVEDKKLSIIQ
jgi:hypothetical protein